MGDQDTDSDQANRRGNPRPPTTDATDTRHTHGTSAGDGDGDGDGDEAETGPDARAETETPTRRARTTGRLGTHRRTRPRRGTGARTPGRLAAVIGWRRSEAWRRWRPRIRTMVFAFAGAAVAVSLAGRIKADVGPFDTTIAARPSLAGQTTVHLAPLGTIVLDTHDWPLAIDLTADQIGLQEAEAIAENPALIERQLGDQVADDIRDGLVRLAIRCMAAAILGGVAGALIARASWRSAAAGVAAGSLLVAGTGAGTAATFDANAVAEPRYTGLLTAAPAAVGDIETIIDRYGEYRAQLSDLVGNVVTLYLAAEGLPTFQPGNDTIAVLHVSDIHLNPQAFDVIDQIVEQFDIDAVADTGDLVDWGTAPETEFVSLIGQIDVPYIYVRGNHDSHSIQAAVADQPNAVVLDGEAAEVAGLRFWGIGDPRYTPNQDRPENAPSEQEEAEAFAPEVAERVAEAEPPDVDVVMIHDQRAAADLGGMVPLVLAGHTHSAREDSIDTAPPEDEDEDDDQDGTTTTDPDDPPVETRLLVEGSTGGAGLRGLQGEDPEPLTATVLYFDPDDQRLVAYDRVTVQGFGETGATIARHVLPLPDDRS